MFEKNDGTENKSTGPFILGSLGPCFLVLNVYNFFALFFFFFFSVAFTFSLDFLAVCLEGEKVRENESSQRKKREREIVRSKVVC